MCTVTWQYTEAGYQLFFNRDELLTRQRALPPTLQCTHNTQFIAPTDTDAGGTWLTVNQHALTLCLLNRYQARTSAADKDWISRGHLVRELAHLSQPKQVIEAINRLQLARYRPFDLLCLSLTGDIQLVSWGGDTLSVTNNPCMPLTSSAYRSQQVIESRTQLFTGATPVSQQPPSQFKKYHTSHLPERGPLSVCMHREDARTVSFSHIEVTTDRISFHYFDGPPCTTQSTSITSLDINQPTQHHLA